MKRINLLIFTVLIGSAFARAQGTNPPQFNPKQIAAQTALDLTQQITITPAIQDSLNNVFITFFEDMKKGQESGVRQDVEKMEANRDLKVKGLLPDDQFKIYLNFMKEKKSRRGGPESDKMHKRPIGQR